MAALPEPTGPGANSVVASVPKLTPPSVKLGWFWAWRWMISLTAWARRMLGSVPAIEPESSTMTSTLLRAVQAAAECGRAAAGDTTTAVMVAAAASAAARRCLWGMWGLLGGDESGFGSTLTQGLRGRKRPGRVAGLPSQG